MVYRASMAKKTKRTPQTDAERKAFDLSRIREYAVINAPTYLYKVGERVVHGAISESHVTEVLDGGKILLLHETVTDNNYGRPVDSERDIYVAWHDVTPWRELGDEKPIKTSTFRLHYSQRDLSGLIHMYYYFGVEMDPDYQRGLVWTLKDKQELIESIFQDVDIGKFVFAHLPFKSKSPTYEIIDGKQRLNALIEYYEGRFEWRGKLYRDLYPGDQSHIDTYPISYAELSERSTRAEILDCFIRLNTSGKPQDPKHLEAVKALLAAERSRKVTGKASNLLNPAGGPGAPQSPPAARGDKDDS
jgi:hypothetical protein